MKTLETICEDIINIEEGLMFGTIEFRYDNLMSAMKPGHPMEILDSILANIYFDVIKKQEIPAEKLESVIEQLESFQEAFQVKELAKPIREMKQHLKEKK